MRYDAEEEDSLFSARPSQGTLVLFKVNELTQNGVVRSLQEETEAFHGHCRAARPEDMQHQVNGQFGGAFPNTTISLFTCRPYLQSCFVQRPTESGND